MKDGTRLNKFLASCAVGSRRACDELIQAGRVEVNGSPCLNLGTRITEGDHVRVDGKRVTPKSLTTVVFHKPRGFVCTKEDELGRDTIYTLLPGALHSLHHVGRLDRDSEGLLILTNDGDLSQRLMHPSKSVEKEYFVTANQSFENVHLDQFLIGVYTPEGKLKAKAIERLSPRRIRVVLEHGAKRQIRVMFDAMGYQVTKLLRVRIGSLWLGDLEPGRWAALAPHEIEMLLANPGQAKPQAHSKKPVLPAKKKVPTTSKRSAPVRGAGPAKKPVGPPTRGKRPGPPPPNKRTRRD
jgi:23S rRNA pseudouridine2605 synthase